MFFLSNNKPFHRAVCHTEEALKTCAITITRASILKFTPVPWIFFVVGKDMLHSRFERNLLESGNLTMCNGKWGNWGDGLGFVGCWGDWRSCEEKKFAQKSFCIVFSIKVWTLPYQKLPDPPLLYMMQSTIMTEIYFRAIRKKYIWTNLHSTENSCSNVSV